VWASRSNHSDRSAAVDARRARSIVTAVNDAIVSRTSRSISES